MRSKGLLLISLLFLYSGAIFGQKRTKNLSVYQQIEQFISESESSSKLSSGDLLISIIDSSRAKNLTRLSSALIKDQSPGDLVFELGDLTQIFTSLLVHELAIEGRLNLEVSINSLLPQQFQSIHFQNVTIQNCLSHTTGLPRIPNNLGSKQIDNNQPFEHYKPDDLAAFLKGWKPSNLDRKYQYSLVGYELVGIILEHQFHRPFGQLIKEIMNPIYGFESLTTEVPKQPRQGKNRVGNEVELLRFGSFLASSGLKGTKNDLARLLLDASCHSRAAFINALKIQSPTYLDPSTTVASGWHHYQVNKHHSFYLHKGSTKGFSSFMAYYPRTNTGVVILSSKKVNLGPMGYYIMGQLNDEWKKPKTSN